MGSVSSFKLSICIPTYNRPKEFLRLLSGVLPQLNDLNNSVELVIRDDSSNAETKEIYDRLLSVEKTPSQYFKGEKIGVDAANLFLLEKARGEFIWWLGDDDELINGGVKEVLKLIQTYPEINMIWANFYYGKNGRKAIDRPSGFFSDGSELLEVLGTSIGLMSTYILRRHTAMSGLEIGKKHVVGFSFALTAVVFHVLTKPGRFYFMRGPFILCHPTSSSDFKILMTKTGKIDNVAFNSYGVDFYNILASFKGQFRPEAVRKLLKVNFAALWRGMLVSWVGGWDTPHGKRWKMFKIYWSFPELWIALPLFMMPLWIIKLFYRIYKIFFTERRLNPRRT